jgi:hypothetical protein
VGSAFVTCFFGKLFDTFTAKGEDEPTDTLWIENRGLQSDFSEKIKWISYEI